MSATSSTTKEYPHTSRGKASAGIRKQFQRLGHRRHAKKQQHHMWHWWRLALACFAVASPVQ
eukprot:12403450-Karenia_brevis.AAC.1